ncbi:MAG: DDE-type integrase/transposase/recombinase [Chloroflexi bacterium]|nr:DDE-type integrase/transposase/recombinase [Chloroflexota bacterium]
MAEKGGALPAYEELELLRREGSVPVRRFLRRLGIPSSTWYHWRAAHLHGRTLRRWPAPVVDAIEEAAAAQAHRWSAWGHRKIWAMLRADGVRVSRSSVLRALARRKLLLPARYQAERRALAVARRALFVEAPSRRNRVWQTDFTEYETSRGGTWRLAPVVDYATKLCLAVPVSGTTGARDAIGALVAAIEAAERLLGHPLLEDCLDPETGEIEPLTIVTDNGPAYKSADFLRFIASRPELAHVRTRHHAPETNGVVERFNETLKYEHLYRLEIPDVIALAEEAEGFRELYNVVRPHETLDFATPASRYLADPGSHLSEPESVQES